MQTFLPFIIYSIIVTGIGLLSLFLNNKSPFQKSIVPTIIFLLSLSAVIYLIAVFNTISANAILELFNWQMPFGKFQFGLDSLSGLFLIPLLILTAATSIYGWKYFGNHGQERTHWLFYTLLVAGMILVLLSRNGLTFIFAWEIMSVASFFLVISDKTNKETIRAGLIYFVTAHFGAALLFIVFFILSSTSGSFDFASWNNLQLSPAKANLVFIFALIAFGSKAGFMPFHIWLPLAHPAAPSHVSALMSGIMIKMGIYGIFRILTFITPYQSWWGILLIGIGSVSGILGVLFAIGQHDIKKLLAYHSVENIGIIMTGMGMGLTGVVYNLPGIAFFGFAGALLHVINHAMFKGLLFLGAGAIIRQTGTGEIDKLGGLIKKMPVTSVLFIIGSVAITGLPFFNGFISEIMIYLASIFGIIGTSNITAAFVSIFTGASLSLIGGLAAACFTKLIGVALLGEQRTILPSPVTEVPKTMILGMIIPAFISIAIGMGSYWIVPVLIKPVSIMTGTLDLKNIELMMDTTKIITILLFSILGIGLLIALLYRAIIRKYKITQNVETWGCGYTAPDVSMEYTASSFAQPVTEYFSIPLNISKNENINADFFPNNKWSFHSAADDWILTKLIEPFIILSNRLFTSFKWFQNGRSGLYVLYIAITILLLITWKFFL